jgi:hypothetical protein
MNDIISAIRRTLQRNLARYVITVIWEGDTFKHYAMKRNEVQEWVDAYPADVDTIVIARY